jgi:hypothetical protein
MTENQAQIIHSIYSDMAEIERMIKALKKIKANFVIFNPYSDDKIMIDAPNFSEYLKQQTILHYTHELEHLRRKLENL